jgi:hypothetical protein
VDSGTFTGGSQHHGYPTPILDWTYSPYIAAFFAYHSITNEQAADAPADAKVRILVFDAQEWNRTFQRITLLDHPKLHLTIFEFIAIENERMIPQQAASTVSTVDDIEIHPGERNEYGADLPPGNRLTRTGTKESDSRTQLHGHNDRSAIRGFGRSLQRIG